MHTETAIVATEIKEVAAVIRRHKIGRVLNEFTPVSLAKTINDIFNNQEELNRYKSNCKTAAQLENWEKETEVLKSIYPHV